jgi:leader peptidase (prepilin peptidase)/N-methyltransferase
VPLLPALLIGALGALLGPALARAAAVLHGRWPTVTDLWEGGEHRLRQRRVAGCTIATASLFTLGALHWGGSARLVPYLLLFAVLVVVAAIDLEHCLIPNRVVFPALGLSVVTAVAASLLDGTATTLGWAALGSVAFCAALLAVHLVNPAGMGFGDVKVALLLGWFLGWTASGGGDALLDVLAALLVASVVGSVVGLVLLVRRGRGAHYPFGPFLALGVIAVLLLPPAI